MNTKNFVVAGIVGFIVDFLLGGLFYGVIFPDIYKTTLNESEHMQFVTLGCLVFGFFVSYVWIKWAGFTNWLSGLKAGAIFGFFYGLYSLLSITKEATPTVDIPYYTIITTYP